MDKELFLTQNNVKKNEDNVPLKVIDSEDGTYSLAVTLVSSNGEKIDSFRNALSIHDADVHRSIFNQFLHMNLNNDKSLTSNAVSNLNQITINNTSGLSVGNEIKIMNEPIIFTIRSINGNTLTLDTPLTFSYDIGTTVKEVTTNLAVNGSLSNPMIFTSDLPSNKIVHITNTNLSILDDNQMDDGSFAGEEALSNGLVIRAVTEGETRVFTNWKRNRDVREDVFSAEYVDKQQSNEYGFSANYNLKQNLGSVIYLEETLGDKYEVLVQDNLTNITSIRIKLQGHYEEL